jgi:hypothetical protein
VRPGLASFRLVGAEDGQSVPSRDLKGHHRGGPRRIRPSVHATRSHAPTLSGMCNPVGDASIRSRPACCSPPGASAGRALPSSSARGMLGAPTPHPGKSAVGRRLPGPATQLVSGLSDKGHTQATTDLTSEQVRDLGVTRDRLDRSSSRIRPKRVRATLTFKVAAVLTEVLNEGTAFH